MLNIFISNCSYYYIVYKNYYANLRGRFNKNSCKFTEDYKIL